MELALALKGGVWRTGELRSTDGGENASADATRKAENPIDPEVRP